jgi:hypothetical protein
MIETKIDAIVEETYNEKQTVDFRNSLLGTNVF